jgi:hypothetical protein
VDYHAAPQIQIISGLQRNPLFDHLLLDHWPRFGWFLKTAALECQYQLTMEPEDVVDHIKPAPNSPRSIGKAIRFEDVGLVGENAHVRE